MGHVWRDHFQLAGIQLRLSTAFHLQTDGQSEAANKTIAMYLRCTTGDRPRDWLKWLPWAEYCYNTAYHSALRTTPFQVIYGRPPPSLLPYEEDSAWTDTVDTMLADRDKFLAEVRTRLLQVQAPTTMTSRSPVASGSGCAFSTDLRNPWCRALWVNWGPSMPGPIRCWPKLAPSPTSCSSQTAPEYTTCSTSEC